MDFDINVKGAEEVERALDQLSPYGQNAIAKEKRKLAKKLADELRRAVVRNSKGRMGQKVRPSIKQSGDRVTADNSSRMLFGTEFGMTRRSGWYANPRYFHSPKRQYFPHNSSGYWWQPTIAASQPEADKAVQRALDDVLGHWGA